MITIFKRGTVETERLLHTLAQQATHPTQRVKRDREAGHSPFEGWLQKFVPQHLPGRDSAAARWHARANKPHPRAPYVTKLPKPKPAAKLHRPVGRPPGQPRVPPSPPSNAEPPPNKRARKTPPTSIRKRAQPKPETPKRDGKQGGTPSRKRPRSPSPISSVPPPPPRPRHGRGNPEAIEL